MLFGDSPKGNKFANAGVGKNNIDSPLHLSHSLVKTIKVGQFGNVSLNSRNVGTDCLHRLVKFLLAAARDEDIGTLFDEKFCRSQPNPFCSAGDDRDLAFELFRHCFSLFLPSSNELSGLRHICTNACRATSEYSRRHPRRTSCKDHATRSRYAALPARCPASGKGETEAAAQRRMRRSPRRRFACSSTR